METNVVGACAPALDTHAIRRALAEHNDRRRAQNLHPIEFFDLSSADRLQVVQRALALKGDADR